MTEKTTFHPTDVVTYRNDDRNLRSPRKYLTLGGQYEVVLVRSDDRYIKVRNDAGLLTIVDRMRFDLAIARHPKTLVEVARKRRKEADAERKSKAKVKREEALRTKALYEEAERLGLAGLLKDRGYAVNRVSTVGTNQQQISKPEPQVEKPLLFGEFTERDVYDCLSMMMQKRTGISVASYRVVGIDKTTEGFKLTMAKA